MLINHLTNILDLAILQKFKVQRFEYSNTTKLICGCAMVFLALQLYFIVMPVIRTKQDMEYTECAVNWIKTSDCRAKTRSCLSGQVKMMV